MHLSKSILCRSTSCHGVKAKCVTNLALAVVGGHMAQTVVQCGADLSDLVSGARAAHHVLLTLRDLLRQLLLQGFYL